MTNAAKHRVFSDARRLVAICGLAVALSAGAAHGQGTIATAASDAAALEEPAQGSGPGSHVVTEVVVRYDTVNANQPAIEELLDVEVKLVETPDGFDAPEGDEPGRVLKLREIATLGGARFTDAGLAALSLPVAKKLKDLGLVGVYAEPDPAQFRVRAGRVVDLRRADDTKLTMIVTVGILTEVVTKGLGSRLNVTETVNNPLHARIRERSPVVASAEGKTDGDLIWRDDIDEYVFRLNRHPGRRVDVVVAPSGDTPSGARLEYLVTENRPWLLYAQVSNTGSASTDRLREQFGFIHNQLTNSDDILSLTYSTANFDDVHAFNGSYERPLPGSDRWRWKAYGSWYQYVASEVGQGGSDFEGDGYSVGGELVWNFFQRRQLFLDLAGGVKWENIRVENNIIAAEGEESFLLPYIQLRLERETESARTNAQLGLDFSVGDLDATELTNLGRVAPDTDFAILRGEITQSFYLDPLFADTTARGGKPGGLVNELLFAVRGQSSLGSRLVPNYEDTAGGLYTVRGYPQSIVAGDDTLIATAEYRFHLPQALGPRPAPGDLFGSPFRWAPQYEFGPTDWDLVFKGFVDAGTVRNADEQSFEFSSDLLGAGVGVELSITRRFSLRVDWGFALQDLTDSTGQTFVDSGHNELQFVLTLIY